MFNNEEFKNKLQIINYYLLSIIFNSSPEQSLRLAVFIKYHFVIKFYKIPYI